MSADQQFVYDTFVSSIPDEPETSICDWGKKHVRLIGSARSEEFDATITPWIVEPIECNRRPGKTSLCKPIQSGGSTGGEVVLCYKLATEVSGDIAYFWPNDTAADGRFVKRFEKILLACKPVMARTDPSRFKWTKGLVIFPHANFEMKGVHSDRAVASDSFKIEVNEELHIEQDGWLPGRLAQAVGRTTAHWNYSIFNISNAGFKNSDWDKVWRAGSQEHWQVLCPSCHRYHELHCQWDDKNPQAGGLRYDATNCRLGNMEYDYNKLAPTIFYQMPCGYTFRDDVTIRRSLSQSGRYGEPKNKGALPNERSFTYEAVSVDFIPFLSIIQRKHEALKSKKTGDYKPWFDYLREVECKFVDIAKDRPRPERVEITTSERKKNRDGLPDRVGRFAYADWQKGKDGDTRHFWLLIQDWKENGDSLIVYEGRIDGPAELIATLRLHEVKPMNVAVDSGWDTTNIRNLCLHEGFNAVHAQDTKSQKHYWEWPDGSTRFYSEPQLICMILNVAPVSPDDPMLEPESWLYSKHVAMERLVFLRQSKEIKYEIPNDVSQEFLEQFDSWDVEVVRTPDGRTKMQWIPKHDNDHLYQCAAGILVMVDRTGIFAGVGMAPAIEQPNTEPEVVTV